MKTIPFSLDKYIPGKSKVVTRDGRDVRILCTDNTGSRPNVVIVGLIDKQPNIWNTNGIWSINGRTKSNDDLFILVEPTLRPWKPEEVPVGALLRRAPWKSIITGVWNNTVYAGADQQWTCHEMVAIDELEHSLDHGKTWLPCGVEE